MDFGNSWKVSPRCADTQKVGRGRGADRGRWVLRPVGGGRAWGGGLLEPFRVDSSGSICVLLPGSPGATGPIPCHLPQQRPEADDGGFLLQRPHQRHLPGVQQAGEGGGAPAGRCLAVDASRSLRNHLQLLASLGFRLGNRKNRVYEESSARQIIFLHGSLGIQCCCSSSLSLRLCRPQITLSPTSERELPSPMPTVPLAPGTAPLPPFPGLVSRKLLSGLEARFSACTLWLLSVSFVVV